MGFYNNLDANEKDQYNVAKESYGIFKGMLGSATKGEKSILRASMKSDKATMRGIASAQRWDTLSSNKHAKRALGSKATGGLQAAGKMKDMTGAQKIQAAQGAGTALKMFNFAGHILDGVTGALGLNTEQVNQASANRAGFGGANVATGLINMIPGAKFMTAFGPTSSKSNESAY
jgi:hypothetical protein